MTHCTRSDCPVVITSLSSGHDVKYGASLSVEQMQYQEGTAVQYGYDLVILHELDYELEISMS